MKKKTIIIISVVSTFILIGSCSLYFILRDKNYQDSDEKNPIPPNVEETPSTDEEEKEQEETDDGEKVEQKTEEEDKKEETTEEKEQPKKETNTETSKPATTKKESYVDQLSDEVILSTKEINSYNQKIKSKTDAIYDMSITSLSKEKIKSYINSYKAPSLPKYNGNKKITTTELNKILDNRNMDNIASQNPLIKGIVVKRSNLRSLPTNTHFYSSTSKKYLDNIQETELLVNTAVLILHESKDGEWYFVLSPTYYGWVEKDTIAQATTDDWNYFLNSDQFVIITDKSVTANNTSLDMSVKLPYVGSSGNNYQVVIPQKNSSGFVEKKNISILKEKANVGYLPYTQKNVYAQAIKYKGTPYQFGGWTGGVDCSSYVSNVFRTFGFQFPRNTSSQNTSVGQIISLSGKSNSSKLKQIEKYPASLLYQSGHVMIYLGKENGKHYIIHANATTLNVAITVLDNSQNLTNINKIVLVK